MSEEADDLAWAKKPDGTMDWDAVFGDPEKGLISLVNKAHSLEVLRQVTVVIIEKLFSRRNDGLIRKKFLKQAHDRLPEDAAEDQLEGLKEGINTLFGSIRDDRKKKAEAYLAAKEKSEHDGRRTSDKGLFPVIRKKIGAMLSVLARPVVAISTVSGIVILVVGWTFIFYAESGPVKSARREAALEWVKAFALKSPPIETAKMVSVKMAKGAIIHLTYRITDAGHAEILKKMSLELDIDLPPTACPAKDSGIMDLITHGFRLEITFESPEGKLSGGICPY